MAKVILMNGWNAPGDRFFRKSPTKSGPPVDIPDEYLEFLPTTAKIVSDDYVMPVKEEKHVNTLSEHRKMLDANDPIRDAFAAEAAVRVKAAEEETRTKSQVKADKEATVTAKFEAKAKAKADVARKRQQTEFKERLAAESKDEEKE